MNSEKIIFLRNLLFRTFIAGMILAIIIFVVTWTFWDQWAPFLNDIFKIEEKDLGKLVVNSFLNLRIFLVFMLLAPAIALHSFAGKNKYR
jgi:uncharacterized membrane protein YqhA